MLGGTGISEFKLEAPGGVIDIKAACSDGKVKSITLRNVPSFVRYRSVIVEVPDFGAISVDVVFSGMWYCVVDTKNVLRPSHRSFPLNPANGKTICRLGEMIKVACREQFPVQHPTMDYEGCDILVFCSFGNEETISDGKAEAICADALC